MADEQKEQDQTPVDQMAVGEVWRLGEVMYDVVHRDGDKVKLHRQPHEKYNTTEYAIHTLTKAMRREKVAGKPHDFTDRYTAAKKTDGTMVQLCSDCGLDGSEPGPCVPKEDWRVEFEKTVAELTDRRTAAIATPRPRETFAQSHAKPFGGIFSLRDELAPARGRR